MRLNTTTGRFATLAVAVVTLAAIVSIGGRAYLNHLSDPPADADAMEDIESDPSDAEPDPVGTCYDLVTDTRDEASDGAQHWEVVHCSRTHTAEVVAIVALAELDLDADTSTWGSAELADATQACADERHRRDLANEGAGDLAGDDAVLTAAVRGEELMCVATSEPHRHLEGRRVEQGADAVTEE